MIVAAALLLAAAGGSLALIGRELRKAPEGYEDDHGFHIVHPRCGRVGERKNWPLNQRPICLQDL